MPSVAQQLLIASAGGGGVITDPSFSSVKLLMGFEGTNGSTGSPGMTDESSAAHGTGTVSTTPKIAQIDTSQFKFGASSLSLSGSGATVSFADSNDWNFAAGNFTVEMFIRAATFGGTQFLVGQWNSSLAWILYISSQKLAWNVSTNGSNSFADIVGATNIGTSAWHHVAIDYDGSKYRVYLDGAKDGSSATARTINNSTDSLLIGSASFPFNANIDELRITKGVARYATDGTFAVPTAAFPRS